MNDKRTVTQHAETLGVSRQSLHKRIKNGKPIPGIERYEMVGNVWILTLSKTKSPEQ